LRIDVRARRRLGCLQSGSARVRNESHYVFAVLLRSMLFNAGAVIVSWNAYYTNPLCSTRGMNKRRCFLLGPASAALDTDGRVGRCLMPLLRRINLVDDARGGGGGGGVLGPELEGDCDGDGGGLAGERADAAGGPSRYAVSID